MISDISLGKQYAAHRDCEKRNGDDNDFHNEGTLALSFRNENRDSTIMDSPISVHCDTDIKPACPLKIPSRGKTTKKPILCSDLLDYRSLPYEPNAKRDKWIYNDDHIILSLRQPYYVGYDQREPCIVASQASLRGCQGISTVVIYETPSRAAKTISPETAKRINKGWHFATLPEE
jgi:hypothetical protein